MKAYRRLQVVGSHLNNVEHKTSNAAHSSGVASGRQYSDTDVFIVGVARTPMGAFNGSLAPMTAPQLGSCAIKGALDRAGVQGGDVQEVFMGNVLSAGMGQAPARQAALGAGISLSCPCTTINKVCSSGMKAMFFAAQSVQLGNHGIVVAGGMESMSNAPYIVPSARFGARLGHKQIIDVMVNDGLWDAYNDVHMGSCGELCAAKYSISRAEQDSYAVASYRRAQQAQSSGVFDSEIVPVSVRKRKKSVTVSRDEVFNKVNFERIPKLRPSFKVPKAAGGGTGTITAANASALSDGAAAMVLMSGAEVRKRGLQPLARIVSMADGAKAPEEFPTAPTIAMTKALDKAGLKSTQIDRFEINEAFSVVVLANMKLMSLPHEKVNVYGGGVSLGHPIGCSGARIVLSLCNALKRSGGKYGLAGICNGGGGASACVVEAWH